jgi:hypothetical protein
MLYHGAIRGFEGPLAPKGCLFGRGIYDTISLVGFTRGYKSEMPRIPDSMMDGAAFQYRTVQEAESRARVGGSSFLVGRLLKGSEEAFGKPLHLPYLVSNSHVVFEGSACVASVNRKDGGEPAVWDIDQNDWQPHPGGDDLAVACVAGHMDSKIHKFSFVEEEHIITPDYIAKNHIGVGDEVFMIGRFVNLQGERTNRTSVRFGSISMMLDMHHVEDSQRLQEEFAVEMRSRTGFSGSPVTVYRIPTSVLGENPSENNNFWCLLGVNYGYIPDEYGENTWLNGVIPAWKIIEILNTPALLAEQEEHEMKIKKQIKKNSGVKLSGANVAPASDENPTHLFQESARRGCENAATRRLNIPKCDCR